MDFEDLKLSSLSKESLQEMVEAKKSWFIEVSLIMAWLTIIEIGKVQSQVESKESWCKVRREGCYFTEHLLLK